MKKYFFPLSIMALMCLNASAQSELPEYVAKKGAKLIKKIKYDFPKEGRKSEKGGGYSVCWKNLKTPPKKVALVSFYTFDPGCTKTYSFKSESEGYYFTTITTTTVHKQLSSKGNAGKIVEGMFYSTIDVLVEKFKNFGMDLLLPEQFLDTQEKKDFYNKFEVQHGGILHWASNLGNSPENDIYGTMEGFRIMNIVGEPTANYEKSGMLKTMGYKRKVSDGEIFHYNSDSKMMNSLGSDLCKKLNVDAVLVIYATIYVPKESKIMLQNINMTMFGLNPVQLGENDKKPFFYHNGQFYCGTRLQPDVPILKINKKDPDSNKLNFTGFKEIFDAMATKMGTYLTTGK